MPSTVRAPVQEELPLDEVSPPEPESSAETNPPDPKSLSAPAYDERGRLCWGSPPQPR